MLQDLAQRLLYPCVVNNMSRIVHGDAWFMKCIVHEMYRLRGARLMRCVSNSNLSFMFLLVY